jgi:polysaccharide biosynthesis/export protein PslD
MRPAPRALRAVFLGGISSILVPAAAAPASDDRAAPALAELASTPSTPFTLSAGDGIEVRFFYNPELNEAAQIRPDGRISLPLVGEVDLKGKTIAEAVRLLEGLYVPHLKSPSITIQVRSYAAQKVYLGGEVVKPGPVSLAGDLTVMDAIMEAGGPKLTGDRSWAVLVRKGPGDAAVMHRIPLKGSKGQPSRASMVHLRPLDVVLVPESGIARFDRWVDQHVRQLLPVNFTFLIDGGVIH